MACTEFVQGSMMWHAKVCCSREDFSLDPEAVLDAVDDRTKMIFLCSPNNPTSNSLDREAMMEIDDGVPCMVVVDEAYIDFSQESGLAFTGP